MTHPTRPAPPGGFCIAAYLMPSPMRGRWHGEAVTDEVEALASTRRSPPHQSPPATASPHRGSHWRVHLQRLPFQGRWLGEAETERSPQICSNLSVTFGDSIPTPFVPSGHFPLIGGIGPWKGSQFAFIPASSARASPRFSRSKRCRRRRWSTPGPKAISTSGATAPRTAQRR